MKKNSLLAFIALSILISCNNSARKKNGDEALADSLEKQVMHGHDIGMARMSKIDKATKQAQQILDSIIRLPFPAQDAIAGYKTQMEVLLKDLHYADFAMNKWMSEFVYDSFSNNTEQRIKYLSDEKIKVEKMTEAILSSLAKADSLLKK